MERSCGMLTCLKAEQAILFRCIYIEALAATSVTVFVTVFCLEGVEKFT
jgi:hypothetical protein